MALPSYLLSASSKHAFALSSHRSLACRSIIGIPIIEITLVLCTIHPVTAGYCPVAVNYIQFRVQGSGFRVLFTLLSALFDMQQVTRQCALLYKASSLVWQLRGQ